MARKYWERDALPIVGLIIMECGNVGLNTLYKAATLQGMSFHVFIVYSYALASLLLLPSPFFSIRSRELPPMSFSIASKILLLGVIGTCSSIMGYKGINYSSPTLASAISNLTPAFTFLLAILFRMEDFSFKRASMVAKMVGTIVSIAGAFIVTLYEGPHLIFKSSPSVSLYQSQLQSQSPNSNWTLGAAFLTIEYLLVPLWYIVQTQIMKEYPAELIVICLYSFCVSFLTAVVTLIAEGKSWSVWMIRPGVALASVVSSGLFGSCINNSVHSWALRIKGPLFVAMFKPLSIAIAVVMGVIFLGDSLYLGSLIGAMIISIGFYTVMWGKAKEEDTVEACGSPTPSQKVPLLQSYNNQDEHV